MTDTAERLRNLAPVTNAETRAAMAEAAAEIERLRAALRGIIGWLDDPKGGSHEEDMREASRIARAALEEK